MQQLKYIGGSESEEIKNLLQIFYQLDANIAYLKGEKGRC